MPSAFQDPRLEQHLAAQAAAEEEQIQALVVQMQASRKDIEQALVKLAELSQELRTKSRRGENAPSMAIYANEHLRYAGAASQGLKRATSSDRILDRAKSEAAQAKIWEERQKQAEASRAARRKVQEAATLLPPDDAFDELYSEVTDG